MYTHNKVEVYIQRRTEKASLIGIACICHCMSYAIDAILPNIILENYTEETLIYIVYLLYSLNKRDLILFTFLTWVWNSFL